ncbi:MAG TPA: hypothetical protein VFC19_00510 [Candidatus Limnocylindrales bacterium]|nr:hypothetical protein [Candidatus Limnocylindrales bacterium]
MSEICGECAILGGENDPAKSSGHGSAIDSTIRELLAAALATQTESPAAQPPASTKDRHRGQFEQALINLQTGPGHLH